MPCKKGDIVAVRDTSPFWDEWRLARCVSASRGGEAKSFSYFGESVSRKPGFGVVVFQINGGDRQYAARRLFELGDKTYSKQNELRQAVLDEAA